MALDRVTSLDQAIVVAEIKEYIPTCGWVYRNEDKYNAATFNKVTRRFAL